MSLSDSHCHGGQKSNFAAAVLTLLTKAFRELAFTLHVAKISFCNLAEGDGSIQQGNIWATGKYLKDAGLKLAQFGKAHTLTNQSRVICCFPSLLDVPLCFLWVSYYTNKLKDQDCSSSPLLVNRWSKGERKHMDINSSNKERLNSLRTFCPNILD